MNSLAQSSLILFLPFITAASIFGADAGTNAASKVYRDKIEPHWFANTNSDTNKFWYRVNLPDDQREFLLVEATKGIRGPAFDHQRLAKALSEKTGQTVAPKQLPL